MILNIKGIIDGLSLYKINGKNVVGKPYGSSAETINNNPKSSPSKKYITQKKMENYYKKVNPKMTVQSF